MNIMVPALWTKDSSFPQGLTVQNTYMELRQGSKKAVVVVRNSMAYPQTLQKKTLVARAVVALPVPKPPMEAQLQEGVTSPSILIPPNWLSGKGMRNYLMNCIWVDWILGLQSCWMQPASSWPSTTMCFHWTSQNWAVPTLPNTR